MTKLSIDQIVALLPLNNEPHSESFALRLLNDQNRVDDAIHVEFIESALLLRATFHATSNPFMQARIFLQRKMTPMTVSDVSTFASIVSELAQKGERSIVMTDVAKALFGRYQIEIDATPKPKPQSRPPRSQSASHGNPIK